MFYSSPSQSIKWGEFPLALSLSQSQPELVMDLSVVWMSFNYLQIISSVTEWTSVTLDSWNVHGWMIPLLSPTPFNICFLYRTSPHYDGMECMEYWCPTEKRNENAGIVSLLAEEALHRWQWRWLILCLWTKGLDGLAPHLCQKRCWKPLCCVGYPGLVFAYTQVSWTPVSSCWTRSWPLGQTKPVLRTSRVTVSMFDIYLFQRTRLINLQLHLGLRQPYPQAWWGSEAELSNQPVALNLQDSRVYSWVQFGRGSQNAGICLWM